MERKKMPKWIIAFIIAVLMLIPSIAFAEMSYLNYKSSTFPLLLASEGIDGTEATVQYIIWTEEQAMVAPIEKKLVRTGLAWNKMRLTDYSGRKAYKYTATLEISKEDEQESFLLYQALNTFSGEKTQVFYQESVYSSMRAETFFDRNGIPIIQKVQDHDMLSLSGFDQRLPGKVKAGDDQINIQILKKECNQNNQGKMVLALPALLEEF